MFEALKALGKRPYKISENQIGFSGPNGYTCYYNKGGRLDMRGPVGRSYDDAVNEIKRGYSKTIVETTAKKVGWTVTQQPSQEANKIKLRIKARGR